MNRYALNFATVGTGPARRGSYRSDLQATSDVINLDRFRGLVEATALPGRYTPDVNPPDEFVEFESYMIEDWDGYGAKALSRETIDTAREVFRRISQFAPPDVAPAADGTIGFEWRVRTERRSKTVLVEIGPESQITIRVQGDQRHQDFFWPSPFAALDGEIEEALTLLM